SVLTWTSDGSKCCRCTLAARNSSSVNGSANSASTSSRCQSWRRGVGAWLTAGMVGSRCRHGGGPASLESMPGPVNQTPRLPVDAIRGCLRCLLPWRPRCLGCGDLVAGALDLCEDCTARLPWNAHRCPACARPLPDRAPSLPCPACRRTPPPVTHVVAPLLYGAPVDQWQPRFKFHQDLAAGRLLAALLA